ncbi:NAD-dependent epimerase/dehydratase family protein [Devosia sp. XJ19-1]|uniref:NAD-dependent epimerase/dehydratase family protein n=1 Tax=Devosia ureilytica TaxID=2952754 RepID=A0A9Q4AL66_9HYPH|nr:NAD-dependent epimerase/dehydratase family protein [Devosia ureilytica]MCP8885647.1 NAD-dependent epimerase/dehydratase family protein [Devosia ureilytica]
MNICLVGAGGGIGRQLLKTFSANHTVSAVYRSLPPLAATNVLAFSDAEGLARVIGQSDVVVHAALNTKVGGQAFIDANRSMTETLLALIQPETCRLFVYFSSQVVYSALDPVEHPVQAEDLPLSESGRLDAYTRLKLADEQRVKSVCLDKGVDYLIVRPTVVMGPHMQWSSGIVDAMRWAPVGLKGRTFNLVHVEDLSRQLLTLIESGVANEVVNLGDLDVSSGDYFRHAAGLARRPIFLVPNWLAGFAGKAIPSTLWFLAHDVRVNTEKVRRLSGIAPNRALGEFFEAPARAVAADDLTVIRGIASAGRPFHTIGRGYFLWFNDQLSTDQLVMEHYAGVVGLEGTELSVRSGTTLRAILDYLQPKGLTLATLPEFVDISAGACFFAEVHGSSSEYISLYDLISAIRYVDRHGDEVFSRRDDAAWDRLRADSSIVVTEVTFRCVPDQRLANVIEWHPDSHLRPYIEGGYRANFSTTVHWYPRGRELMVYNVNPVGEHHPKDRGPFAPMRGSPAPIQKLLLSLRLRGRLRIVGTTEQVLAPWKGVPAKHLVGNLFRNGKRRIRNMELCLPDTLAPEFFERLRRGLPDMNIHPGQGIGVRFTREPETNRGFVWVEMTSRNAAQMHAMIEMAHDVCGESFWLHRGKYVPAWVGVQHLFIARAQDPRLAQP